MDLSTRLAEVLAAIGDDSGIRSVRPVSGGDINRAWCVETGQGRYFVKTNERVPAGFFQSEAEGLEQIRATGTIAVPQVFHVSDPPREGAGMLVLEWLEGTKTSRTEEELGRRLAALHLVPAQRYGYHADTFIGQLPQPNGWFDDWVAYYRECRLKPQLQLAERLGRMPTERRRRLIAVMERLNQWLPRDCRPSLLHGDLWGGNWLAGPGGLPYLVDPSVLYGHAEMELAFTELFGGFSPVFYRSYAEVLPPSSEYAERKPLYQLFYLLVHLNLFGESYGGSVDRILTRYGG